MAEVSGVVYDTAGAVAGGRTVRLYRRDTGALLASRLSASGYVAADADYANVSLLLHGFGADGSTVFEDSSPLQNLVTPYGNVQISTAQSKFSGSSMYFDGTGDYLSVPSSTDLDFGTGNYAMELFIRPTSLAAMTLLSRYSVWTSSTAFYLATLATGAVQLRAGNSVPINIQSAAAAITAGAWNHIAVTCDSGTTRLFVNGSLEESTGTTASISSTAPMGIGYELSGGVAYFNGYMADIRITKGASRYTAGFTPHTVAHPDSDTALSNGEYSISNPYTGEVNVIALDDSGGTVTNDIIIRTTPV